MRELCNSLKFTPDGIWGKKKGAGLDLKARLVAQAEEVGFDLCRICRPDAIPQVPEGLRGFLAQNYQGQMGWLADRVHWREDPQVLWPEARSIIMLGESYTPDHDPTRVHEQADRGAISVYAQNKDYHDVAKKRLKRLGRWLIEAAQRQGQEAEIKVFVDTAPVMEKPLGMAAGLGWQGKHTNLVSRKLGSWFFLGAIFTTLELEPDEAGEDRCGQCRACLDVCPTDAFPAPYQLDARRCISYLTIEHKGPVDEALREGLGNHIYGCDDCLAACPWNKFAQEAHEAKYHARDELKAPKLAELVVLDDAGFRALFSGSPIKRAGRDRFVRNVLYAIGNSGDSGLAEYVRPLCDDPDVAVADAARWALARIS